MSNNDLIERYIFRMVHKDNLEYILNNGLYSKNHKMADPNYISIGDSDIIDRRKDYAIRINSPGGLLSEYIPFYFAGHSPMLLNIKTGYRSVTKRHQSDIVFIVCKIKDIIEQCKEWCFTDGHAMKMFSCFYNDVKDLDKLDWDMITQQYWSNAEEDNDRMRRKEAEFLIKYHVPISCIAALIVKDNNTMEFASKIMCNTQKNIKIYVDNNNQYFYP